MPLDLIVPATDDNFDDERYLAGNPDVRASIARGRTNSAWDHFKQLGRRQGRLISLPHPSLPAARARKMERLRPFLRQDMDCVWQDDRADFLTAELRESSRIVATEAISSHGYDQHGLDLIHGNPEGLVLDCGAGNRPVYFENVVNFEIVDYPSTDVLGVGEKLPFLDATFDGVISVAVLEHVRDPFLCAREIARVLKPGGRLYCAMPFLQPYHGYPHHYFNATAQGLRRLFEDALLVEDVQVVDATHPIWALQWILRSWSDGLAPDVRKKFHKMSVADLMRAPSDQIESAFCRQLAPEKQLELACATVLRARKSG